MDALYAALLSWAVTLSGYPAPVAMPEVAFISHAELEQKACAARPCRVVGWYPHDGGNHIYLDDRLKPQTDLFAASIVVHEFVHLLQQKAGRFGELCRDAIELEYQAYGVQQRFLTAYGVYRPVGLSAMSAACDPPH